MLTEKHDPWNPPTEILKDCNAEVDEVTRYHYEHQTVLKLIITQSAKAYWHLHLPILRPTSSVPLHSSRWQLTLFRLPTQNSIETRLDFERL